MENDWAKEARVRHIYSQKKEKKKRSGRWLGRKSSDLALSTKGCAIRNMWLYNILPIRNACQLNISSKCERRPAGRRLRVLVLVVWRVVSTPVAAPLPPPHSTPTLSSPATLVSSPRYFLYLVKVNVSLILVRCRNIRFSFFFPQIFPKFSPIFLNTLLGRLNGVADILWIFG